MADPRSAVVLEDELLPHCAVLNDGGFGIVYDLGHYRLPGDPRPMIYKKFKHTTVHSLPMAPLLAVIEARKRLSGALLDEFDQLTAWPLRIATGRDGSVRGVVMPLVPDDYQQMMQLPSGGQKRRSREVQYLLVDPQRAQRWGIDVPTGPRGFVDRLLICRQFARAMELMHRCRIVYGDVSARNALYRVSPTPGIVFVDCDAVRLRGSSPFVQQGNSPDWEPPGAEGSTQNMATDAYKLALFVLRCLCSGVDRQSLLRDPAAIGGRLDGAGLDLLTRALTGAPRQRPTPAEWVGYLDQVIDELTQPPQVVSLTCDLTSVFADEQVVVSWVTRRASNITLTHSAGGRWTFDARKGSGALAVVVPGTGWFCGRAGNDTADSAEMRSETVRVLPRPTLDVVHVPDPQLTAFLWQLTDRRLVPELWPVPELRPATELRLATEADIALSFPRPPPGLARALELVGGDAVHRSPGPYTVPLTKGRPKRWFRRS